MPGVILKSVVFAAVKKQQLKKKKKTQYVIYAYVTHDSR